VGLKLGDSVNSRLGNFARSNRTIVGLKRYHAEEVDGQPCSSNRTIVGLKLDYRLTTLVNDLGSNRTIVGLKLYRYRSTVKDICAAIAPLWD